MGRRDQTGDHHVITGLILVILLKNACTATSANCGGFVRVSGSGSGHLTTPNYPAAYPPSTRCVWLLEAASEHKVTLTVTFEGQETNTTGGYSCNDYIQIRDGSKTSPVLMTSCTNLMSYNVTSSARWAWVLFSSDESINNAGLNASYSALFVGSVINNITSPVRECRTFEFTCSNKECLSLSYRCDGYFDCGCADGGCDEDQCGGLTMPYWARMVMGIGIGICLFIMVCMASLLWERRHNWAKLRAHDAEKTKHKK